MAKAISVPAVNNAPAPVSLADALKGNVTLMTLDEARASADASFNRRNKRTGARGRSASGSGCNYSFPSMKRSYMKLLKYVQENPGTTRADIFLNVNHFAKACFYEMQRIGLFFGQPDPKHPRTKNFYILPAGEELIALAEQLDKSDPSATSTN